jgi:hypothetical protein
MELSPDAQQLLKAIADERSLLLQPLYDELNRLRAEAANVIRDAALNRTEMDAVGRATGVAQAFGLLSAAHVITVAVRRVEDRMAARLMAEPEPQELIKLVEVPGDVPPVEDMTATQRSALLNDLLLDALGYVNGAETSADGSASNDLAHDRFEVALAFVQLIRQASWPEGYLKAARQYSNPQRAHDDDE